jgi:hypothetical protein
VPIPTGCVRCWMRTRRRMLGPFLFPDPAGKPWSERVFYRNRLVSGEGRVSGWMCCRTISWHSFVSHMRAAGVDPADLASATGHTVATATGHYTHSTGATFDLMRSVAG